MGRPDKAPCRIERLGDHRTTLGVTEVNLAHKLLLPAKSQPGWSGTVMEVETEEVGFECLNFQVRRLAAGESQTGETGENEMGMVVSRWLLQRQFIARSVG
jgi:hypothetical protein